MTLILRAQMFYLDLCKYHLSSENYENSVLSYKSRKSRRTENFIFYFRSFLTKLTLLLIDRYVLLVRLRRLVDGEIPCPPIVWYWLRSVPERLQLLLWQTKILNNELSLTPMKDFNLVLAEYKNSIFRRNLLGRRPAPPRGFLAAIIRT